METALVVLYFAVLLLLCGYGVHRAHLVLLVGRNRRALARAANTGISGFIDPVGRVLDATPLMEEAAVTRALQEFIARREQRRVLELFATLDWDPEYDYKAERSRD